MSKRKYRTTLIIETDQYPKEWSLDNFYWAVENGEAEECSRITELNSDADPKPSKDDC